MIRAYDELVDFIAGGTTPESVAAHTASEETRHRIAVLIAAEKDGSLTDEERSELNCYMQLEHLMRLAKARARGNRA